MVVIAVISNISVYTTHIASGSRGFFCLSEDHLAPPFFVKMDQKHGIPYVGEDKTRAGRDIYSVVYCTVSPLCHDEEMLEANIELCKYKVPVVAMPMPAAATTGPASLYSNVAMSNAEALSALVMFELTEPGMPFIYSSEWVSLGSRDLDDVAREKARQILAGEQKHPLPYDTAKVIREIIEEACAKLTESRMQGLFILFL